MIVMLNLNAKIFELLDEKFDLVLLGISAHVAEFFVIVSGYDLVNNPSNSIGYGDLGLVGRA